MKPARFHYAAAGSASEAIGLLAEHQEDGRILAGGQSLVVLLNMRLAQTKYLIDISACPDLQYIRVEKGYVCIGASTTQSALQQWSEIEQKLPLLAEAIPFISHFQVRNRGTVVGSIAHADPSAEIPLCLAVLKGSVVLESKAKGRHEVPAASFQQGMLVTARNPDELVREAKIPVAEPGHGYAFDEFGMRRGDFAIVAVAVDAGPNSIRIGIGGVADKPVVVEWPLLEGSALDSALNDLAWQLKAQGDAHATAAYRRQLVRVLGQKTIARARQRQLVAGETHVK